MTLSSTTRDESVSGLLWFTPEDADAEAFAATVALAGDRLGDADGLRACWQARPELVVGCRGTSAVIGVCFASTEQRADEVGLRGVAVATPRAGRGIGGKLLERFEDAVRRSGYGRIGLGSAHGYVERFYLTHGYEQTELMVTMPPGVPRPPGTDDLPVLRPRSIDGCAVFNVPARGYVPNAAEELRRLLGAADVICIFYKTITPGTGEHSPNA
jgi:GNAT superfamily N-acetyltransferase